MPASFRHDPVCILFGSPPSWWNFKHAVFVPSRHWAGAGCQHGPISIILPVIYQQSALEAGEPAQTQAPLEAGCSLAGRVDSHQIMTQRFSDF